MKISLTQYGRTVAVETDHDDVDLDEALEMTEDVLRAAGFPVTCGSLAVDTDGPESAPVPVRTPNIVSFPPRRPQ